MREYLTADDICNQISMNRSVFKGNIIITEGNTDQRLFNKFVDRDETRIIPAHSKDNVCSVVNKMTSRRDGKVLGIVDRDIDELKGRLLSPPIFYTDYRDMEMMLINSPALDNVLMEYADPDRMDHFVKQYGEIRDVIISSAYHIGLLMYVSYIRGYNLNFKDLNFRSFISRKDLSINLQDMVLEVVRNTAGCELSVKGVVKDLISFESKYPNKVAISRGHDSVDILIIGLKDVFGAYNSSYLNEGSLGGALRLTYTSDLFAKTGIFAETSRWAESRNTKLWNVTPIPYPRS